MENFMSTLTGIEKVLYRTAYNFEMKYGSESTEESAHAAGLKEIERISNMRKDFDKPQKYVDISTGKTFTSTESELMGRNA